MASARNASLNGGPGAELPAGFRGAEPLMGVRGKAFLKLNAFCPFSCKKKWPKGKDLNENLPTCLRQRLLRAATISPKF